MQTITLSELAVAVLRLHVEGEKRPIPANERNLPAFEELVGAGLMEPIPGAERIYRLTAEGREHREGIVERETDRIERGRYAPPDVSRLSHPAWGLLHQMASGEEVQVTPETRSLLRELAEARIILVINTFARGLESGWQWTYWGWKRKAEWVKIARARVAG